MSAAIEERAAFDFIRYASVWEDADILCEALAPAAQGGRVLSVASAGDNVLALLTLDPEEVVAVDLSPAQLAALELRIVAFRELEHDELLVLLGVEAGGSAGSGGGPGATVDAAPAAGADPTGDRRLAVYRRLRPRLGAGARAFWDAHPGAVAGGVIHAGRFEAYLRLFRRRILPLVHPRSRIERLLAASTLPEQEQFYRDEWDRWRWRLVFRLFFSRFIMGRLGRDPAFFEHVEGSVGDRLLERTRHALTAVPVGSNPYLAYIMTGNYTASALPRYLRPEHFEAIRGRLDRVVPVRGPAESAPGTFDAFNLSDIFEYMDPDDHERAYLALLDLARPGARLAYWNMLAPRGVPAAAAGRACPLEALSRELHRRDRAWFYQAFHVDEVPGDPGEATWSP